MKHTALLLLLVAGMSAQHDDPAKQLRPGIQFEIGYVGHYSSSALSLDELIVLSRGHVVTEAEPLRHSGSSTTISAPYLTLYFEMPFGTKSQMLWAIGCSFLNRNVASGYYSVDSINHFQTKNLQGEPVTIYNKETISYSAHIYVRQLSLPIGVRFRFKAKKLDWLQAGVNIAPGITFTHRLHQPGSASFFQLVQPENAPLPEEWSSALIYSRPVNKYHLLPGNFFTCYAGIPVQASYNRFSRVQFLLSFEPGYSYTFLDSDIIQGKIMSRLGIGVKYLL